jgi:hypothetical protein
VLWRNVNKSFFSSHNWSSPCTFGFLFVCLFYNIIYISLFSDSLRNHSLLKLSDATPACTHVRPTAASASADTPATSAPRRSSSRYLWVRIRSVLLLNFFFSNPSPEFFMLYRPTWK